MIPLKKRKGHAGVHGLFKKLFASSQAEKSETTMSILPYFPLFVNAENCNFSSIDTLQVDSDCDRANVLFREVQS